MDNTEIKHESGLVFLPAEYGAMNASVRHPSRCWGKLLNKPDFTDLAGFADAVGKLDTVEKVPVATQVGGQWTEAKDWLAVRSTVSGKTYQFVSPDYQVVQDTDIVTPFYEACAQSGIKPIGRFDGVGSGRTRGHVILANPEFRIQLLKAYEDPMMLGLKLDNSFNTESGFGAEVFGIREVCINYNLWGEVMGKFRHKHLGDVQAMTADYTALVKSMLERVPTLQALIEAASNHLVLTAEVEDLLWGIKMPLRGIDQVAFNTEAWAPEVKSHGLTGWVLYNAVTAYITHREGSGSALQSTEAYTKSAVKLLTESHDRLIAEGRKAKEAYLEARKAKEEKKTLEVAPRMVA